MQPTLSKVWESKNAQQQCKKKKEGIKKALRLPGVEPGSIAWKAIILTVGLQTPRCRSQHWKAYFFRKPSEQGFYPNNEMFMILNEKRL